MTPEEILARLVGFPSVVGRANGEIVAFVRDVCEVAGASVAVLPGPEGDRANLFATIGPRDVPGVVLSGHMDVVPAGEPGWSSDPFTLRREGERLYGRGTSDMKGFLAAVLAALPRLAAVKLAKPIHLAFSYDEEAGCRGAPHLIAALPSLCATPEACIVGEPSGLRAIRAHKGKAAARIGIGGRSGHSSRPDLGLNAIHAMAEVLTAAQEQADLLSKGPFDPRFAPPYSSLQVGTLRGGQALNIIPDACTAEIEARAVAGVDPLGLLQPVRAAAMALVERGFSVDWDVLSHYPALSLDEDAPLARLLEDLTGKVPLAAVSYGTEAGLYQAAGIASIICGPGDIARAHKADEYIEAGELAAAVALVEAFGERLCA
ncbi:acetylornithine deacetylase [Aureimonas pseudogalii]|uniref:Acetylornithine deacetylase n=1 Tax=Aureimonas pseudogalii TaxID=1744844 RepID=A0A7W6H476_9HYPH|nr:acetylornithine deacetylase [Aureimonas pseudogalii]MBB3996709.1 acetylornithine deacetylase [Aureimonas pseudogalii]